MTAVADVRLRRILDSRGDATVEAEVIADGADGDPAFGRAAAPSGASTGAHEAVELPADEAVAAGERAGEALEGVDVEDQGAIDATLADVDGTDDFSGIGANAAVAVSMAAARAAADATGEAVHERLGGSALPTPLGNVVGGGEHARDATDIQEFLLAPVGAPSVEEAVFANARIHAAIGDVLAERGAACGKGDEGAWAPTIDDATAFAVIDEAIDRVDPPFAVRVGLDVAATELWDGDAYVYEDAERSPAEQIDYVEELIREHDLVYVEDPLEEDDFGGFAELTERVTDTDALVCGDDLFVTNPERIERGIEEGAANSVLIKPNQIGTVTLTAEAIDAARRGGYDAVLSHRSGETEDATIAQLAVGFETRFIKTGTVGGERTAKLNELIRIQHAQEA